MIKTFRDGAELLNSKFVGRKQTILIEGVRMLIFLNIFTYFFLNFRFQQSKKSEYELFGRNDANIKVIIPAIDIPIDHQNTEKRPIVAGDFVSAEILESNSQILKGKPLYHTVISYSV